MNRKLEISFKELKTNFNLSWAVEVDGHYAGEIIRWDVDRHVFDPADETEYEVSMLRAIADKLDELNGTTK